MGGKPFTGKVKIDVPLEWAVGYVVAFGETVGFVHDVVEIEGELRVFVRGQDQSLRFPAGSTISLTELAISEEDWGDLL